MMLEGSPAFRFCLRGERPALWLVHESEDLPILSESEGKHARRGIVTDDTIATHGFLPVVARGDEASAAIGPNIDPVICASTFRLPPLAGELGRDRSGRSRCEKR